MCEISQACKTAPVFWVMTRREYPASCGCPGGRNVTACAKHLARAVRTVVTVNREMAGHVSRPATDGVIVKQLVDGAWR